MVIETLMFGYGGACVVFFLAYCAGGNWRGGAPHYKEDNPVETLKEMEL